MHICQPAVTLPTTPTSHELSVQNVSPMIACRFLECLRDGATAVCLWMARGLLGLAQTRKREIRGKQSKRAVGSVRSGFNLVWQRTEARQDAEVTLQNTVASVFVTRPDLLSRSVLTTSEVQVLLNTDRVMGHDHGFSVAGGFVSPVPKVDTAAHPPLGSALFYRQTIYISLNGKTPVSQKTMMAFSSPGSVYLDWVCLSRW